MLVFINYWIEKCTVKHWNPFFLIFRDSPGFMGFKGPCPGIGSVLRMSCRNSKSKNMTFLIMQTHILTFPRWDEISIAVEQPSASQWQQEQERARKMCGLVIVECGLSLWRVRVRYAKWTECLSEWYFSEYYYFSVGICLHNSSFVQNAGIRKTRVAPCTQHALYWTARDNRNVVV
jgi:hypothetical protein